MISRTLGITILFVLSFLSSNTYAHFGSKGPFGGTVSCITYNDSLVYIGTANGGVFESTNNSLSAWRARPVGLTSGKISALTHSGSYLFAATADSGVFIFNGFVGADRYWNKINNGLTNLHIKSLLAIDSITVIAGTDGNGLFKTTNKGASWTPINVPSLNNGVITGIIKAGNRIILVSQNAGVFVSDNNGDTWADFNDVNTVGIAGTNFLSYNSISDELLVVNDNGIYLAASASTSNSPSFVLSQNSFPANTAIRGVSNNGTDWYLATDKGVFTKPTANINWTNINTGLSSLDITAIGAIQNRLVAGVNKEGVFKATSGTNVWAALNTNFNNPLTHTMAAAGDSLIVAVTDKGVSISKNLATSYAMANNGLTDSLNINDILVANGVLLAATKNAGVFFSTNTGNTWTATNAGLTNMNITKLFYANHIKYAIDASGNLFSSELHSATWTAIQDGLPSGVMPTSMAFYGGKLVLGTLGNGVFVSEQSSINWTAENAGLSNLDVTSVATSGNKVFAGTQGSGVFVSDIDIINWNATAATSISHTTMIGLNGNNIQAMASYGGYVYASYKGGLLATSNNGATWIAGGNQFNLPSFTDVKKISFVSTRVFVSTENNAVYSNSLSELPALADTLIVSRNTAAVLSADTAFVVSVTSNRDWTVTTDQPWLMLTAASGFRDGDFNIIVAENTGAARSGTVTVTAGTKIQTIEVTQDGTTAAQPLDEINNLLKIYPNPAHKNFTADFSQMNAEVTQVAVYDISGKMLRQLSVEDGQESLLVSIDFPAGIYIIKLQTSKGIVAQRLSVK